VLSQDTPQVTNTLEKDRDEELQKTSTTHPIQTTMNKPSKKDTADSSVVFGPDVLVLPFTTKNVEWWGTGGTPPDKKIKQPVPQKKIIPPQELKLEDTCNGWLPTTRQRPSTEFKGFTADLLKICERHGHRTYVQKIRFRKRLEVQQRSDTYQKYGKFDRIGTIDEDYTSSSYLSSYESYDYTSDYSYSDESEEDEGQNEDVSPDKDGTGRRRRSSLQNDPGAHEKDEPRRRRRNSLQNDPGAHEKDEPRRRRRSSLQNDPGAHDKDEPRRRRRSSLQNEPGAYDKDEPRRRRRSSLPDGLNETDEPRRRRRSSLPDGLNETDEPRRRRRSSLPSESNENDRAVRHRRRRSSLSTLQDKDDNSHGRQSTIQEEESQSIHTKKEEVDSRVSSHSTNERSDSKNSKESHISRRASVQSRVSFSYNTPETIFLEQISEEDITQRLSTTTEHVEEEEMYNSSAPNVIFTECEARTGEDTEKSYPSSRLSAPTILIHDENPRKRRKSRVSFIDRELTATPTLTIEVHEYQEESPESSPDWAKSRHSIHDEEEEDSDEDEDDFIDHTTLLNTERNTLIRDESDDIFLSEIDQFLEQNPIKKGRSIVIQGAVIDKISGVRYEGHGSKERGGDASVPKMDEMHMSVDTSDTDDDQSGAVTKMDDASDMRGGDTLDKVGHRDTFSSKMEDSMDTLIGRVQLRHSQRDSENPSVRGLRSVEHSKSDNESIISGYVMGTKRDGEDEDWLEKKSLPSLHNGIHERHSLINFDNDGDIMSRTSNSVSMLSTQMRRIQASVSHHEAAVPSGRNSLRPIPNFEDITSESQNHSVRRLPGLRTSDSVGKQILRTSVPHFPSAVSENPEEIDDSNELHGLRQFTNKSSMSIENCGIKPRRPSIPRLFDNHSFFSEEKSITSSHLKSDECENATRTSYHTHHSRETNDVEVDGVLKNTIDISDGNYEKKSIREQEVDDLLKNTINISDGNYEKKSIRDHEHSLQKDVHEMNLVPDSKHHTQETEHVEDSNIFQNKIQYLENHDIQDLEQFLEQEIQREDNQSYYSDDMIENDMLESEFQENGSYWSEEFEDCDGIFQEGDEEELFYEEEGSHVLQDGVKGMEENPSPTIGQETEKVSPDGRQEPLPIVSSDGRDGTEC